MSDRTVFRTSDPARLDAWERWKKDAAAWERRLKRLIKDLNPGPGKREGMMTNGGGTRRFVGFSCGYREDPPAGWRVDKNGPALVPRMSNKEGKAAAKRITDLGPRPHPKDALAGMPSMHFSGMAFHHPGAERHGDALYVTWATDTPPKEIGAEWEPVKLSEWYSLVESKAEAAS